MIPAAPPAYVIHFTPPPAPAPLNLPRFLRVLAVAESANSWHKIGPNGERSPWQIKRIVWQQHMPRHLDFDRYGSDHQHPNVARMCVDRHLAWLIPLLQRRHIAITAQNLTTCWRLGAAAGIRRIQDRNWPDEAMRVAALYRQ